MDPLSCYKNNSINHYESTINSSIPNSFQFIIKIFVFAVSNTVYCVNEIVTFPLGNSEKISFGH